MTEDLGSESDVVIERGGMYEHETHGRVKVLGIWRGVHSVDEAGNLDDAEGPKIVCYTIREGGQPVGELTDTLESFLAAIESTD